METARPDGGHTRELDVDAAATAVAEAEATSVDSHEEAAAMLRGIAADDVVTDESVQSALAHLSKVVSTPATRVELSGIELDSAREDASEVADVPTVAARLDRFAAEVARIESAVEALDDDLRALTDRATGGPVADRSTGSEAPELYEIAAERRRIHSEATRLQGAADELTTEIESFRRWLSQATVRRGELREDAEELDRTAETLEADVAALVGADTDDQNDGLPENDAEAWFDCVLRHRVLALQAEDLRAAAADTETVNERLGVDPEAAALDDVRELVGTVRTRLDETVDRLDTVARPEWRDRFSRKLEAFEGKLSSVAPPVEWAAVLTALNEARGDCRSSTRTP